MFFNNKFNTFFGLNLTLVYTFPMCTTWRFHFPLRNYDFKPSPVLQLPVLAGIAPAGLRREAATLALARKAVKHDWHILHDTTKNEVPPCRLKSRKPYNKEAQEMLSVIPEVEGCVDCGNVEAGVGSIRTHPSTPLCVGPRRGRQGRRDSREKT